MGFTAIIHVRWTQNLDYVQTHITSLILKKKFNGSIPAFHLRSERNETLQLKMSNVKTWPHSVCLFVHLCYNTVKIKKLGTFPFSLMPYTRTNDRRKSKKKLQQQSRKRHLRGVIPKEWAKAYLSPLKYRFARAKRGSALPIEPLRGHSGGIGEAQCEACPPQISWLHSE